MQKNAIWLSIWFVLLLVLVGTVLWRFVPRGQAAPAELAERAMSAATPEEQTSAASELVARGEAARGHLRRLMNDSHNDNVRAIAMDGLGGLVDYKSIEPLFAAMEDESLLIRTRAGAAVGRIVGFDRRFDANAAPEQRKKSITLTRADWELLSKSAYVQELMSAQAVKEESNATP